MSDTPSFNDVASQAFDSQVEATPVTPEPLKVTESPKTEPETATPEGQAAEQQTQDESFTTFNPNELPPELLTVYKGWQADYTRTRQKEKAEVKELREKLAKYEQTAQPTQTEVNDYKAGIQNGQIDPKMTLAEYTQLVKDQTKSEIKAEMKTEQENSYIESQEREFLNLDPRFSEGPGLDEVLLNYVAGKLGAMRGEYEAEHGDSVLGFDFIGNAKKLIAQYDERVTQSNKAFIAKQSEQAKLNASQSAKAMPKASNSAGKPSGSVSFNDAFDTAWSKTNAN